MKEKNTEVLEQLVTFDTGYEFRLENFEGPLDLLLHLIKEAKMEIGEIKLADITEQYLDYLAGLEELDLEKASDFIDIAATLIEIKSKSLLPKEEDQQSDELDCEAELLRQLKEYKLFKEASERLKVFENVSRFYRAADEKVNDYRYVLGEMNIEGLLNAFALMLTRVKQEEEKFVPKKIEKDRWTVAEKIVSIRQCILKNKKLKFSQLFTNDYTRSEFINLFLAVLELLKMQEIIIKQDKIYDEIDIELREKEEIKDAN